MAHVSLKPRAHRKRAQVASVQASATDGAWDKISTDELTDWQKQGPPTPLLDTVNFPVHIKNFNTRQLKQLCKELRAGKKRSCLFDSHSCQDGRLFFLIRALTSLIAHHHRRLDSHRGKNWRALGLQFGSCGAYSCIAPCF